MKLKEYCECGGQLTGIITPDYKAFEMQRVFWKIHSGIGHSVVEPSQCYSARRRQELKTVRIGTQTVEEAIEGEVIKESE